MSIMSLSQSEYRVVSISAVIMALRMLGLFMIFPVFSVYAHQLIGATPTLIGLAMGIYGFTQAIFQIPLGMLSDHFGRRIIITIGLIIFAMGSVIAAASDTIIGVIVGRALQGAGAIGSTVLALVADSTHEEKRTQVMAIIGMTIGLSFALAMVLGPIISQWLTVRSIFYLTAILALLGIIVLLAWLKQPPVLRWHRDTQPELTQFFTILRQPELLRLNVSIFMLHTLLTATFVVTPLLLAQRLHLSSAVIWWFYLPIIIAALLIAIPAMIMVERRQQLKAGLLSAILVLMIAQLGLWLLPVVLPMVIFSLVLFFAAFTLLEAMLPALVSRAAPIARKGTALGIYSSCQFMGIFVGGLLAGWLYGHLGITSVYEVLAGLVGVWLLLMMDMANPAYLVTHSAKLDYLKQKQAEYLLEQLLQVDGIVEVSIVPEESIAYLKLNKRIIDPAKIEVIIKQLYSQQFGAK